MVDKFLDGRRVRRICTLSRRELLVPILAGTIRVLKDHLVHVDAIAVALLGQQRRRAPNRSLKLDGKLRGLVVASIITLAVADGGGATSLAGSSTLGFVLFTALLFLGKRIGDHLINRVVKRLVDIIKRVIHHILVPLLHGIRELLLALLGRGGMLFGRSVGVKTQHGHKLSIGDAVGLRHKDLLKVAAVHIGRVIRLVKLVEQLKVTLVHILRYIAHMGALARLLSQRNRHRLAIHAVHVQVERVGGLFVSHLERDIERPVGVLLLRQMMEGPQTLAGVLAVLDQALRTATIRHIKVPDRSARNIAHIIASRHLCGSGGNIGRAHARLERHALGGKRILRQVVFNLGTAEFIGLASVLCGRGARAHGKLHAFAGRRINVGHIAQQAVNVGVVDLDARSANLEHGASQRQCHLAQRNKRRDSKDARDLRLKAHKHIGAHALLHIENEVVALPCRVSPPCTGAITGIARACGHILDGILGQRNLNLGSLAVLELVMDAQLGLHANDRGRISNNRARRQPALGTIRLHVKRGDVERHVELFAVLNLHLLLRDMLTHGQP